MPIAGTVGPEVAGTPIDAASEARFDDDGGPTDGGEGAAEPLTRQCGRCRGMFAADADLDADALRAWWVCPPCRIALFGSHPRMSGSGPTRPTASRGQGGAS